MLKKQHFLWKNYFNYPPNQSIKDNYTNTINVGFKDLRDLCNVKKYNHPNFTDEELKGTNGNTADLC